MAYIGGGEQPRHATVEAMSDLLLAEFEPAALDKMSLGAQLQRLRALARFVPFHRVFHSVEMTLLALAAAVADALLGGDLDGTRFLVAALLPVAAVTVVGHLLAIVTSSRLR
jgi:hypothetical protein